VKPIPNYPGYFASENGDIYSTMKGRLKKIKQPRWGLYKMASLSKDKKKQIRLVHQVILETFIGPRPKGMWACHGKNGSQDNSIGNLSWGTKSKNLGADKVRDGTLRFGENHHRAKLNAMQVRIIRHRREYRIPSTFLGRIFHVHSATIRRISDGLSWKETR